MKKLMAVIGVACALSFSASASTNGIVGFVNQVGEWIGTLNTNYDVSIQASKVRLWAGVDSVQGGNATLVNEIGVAFDGLKTNKLVSLEGVVRNGGVAGTLISAQGGASLNFILHDLMLSIYCDGGKYVDNVVGDNGKKNEMYGEFGVRAFKALGPNTGAFVGLGAQFPTSHQIYEGGIFIRL